eukprot:TRINITY_DN43715_c0_g1_i1.p1 TRINITY_DN43715_c0_g1~~TRINITY_DN43715_c0_g1_i1.p1  ORF type:complete len:450 (+),score=144.47 TRINITY_DN43715_c0_g1_i1:43-1392(+)
MWRTGASDRPWSEGGTAEARSQLRGELAELHQVLADEAAESGDADASAHHRAKAKLWGRIQAPPDSRDTGTQCDGSGLAPASAVCSPERDAGHARSPTERPTSASVALCIARAELKELEGVPREDSIAMQRKFDAALGDLPPELSDYRKQQWLKETLMPSAFAAARDEGMARLAQGMKADAAQSFSLAVELAGNVEEKAEAFSALARCRLSCSDSEGCVDALQDALRCLDQDKTSVPPLRRALLYVHLLTSLARALHCDGQPAAAVSRYRKALKLLPSRPEGGWTGGRAEGQAAEETAWDEELRFSLLLNCGDSLAAMGDHDAAADHFAKAQKEAAADGSELRRWAAHAKLAQALYNAGYLDQGAQHAEQAIAIGRRLDVDTEPVELLLQLCRARPEPVAEEVPPEEEYLRRLLREQREGGDLDRREEWPFRALASQPAPYQVAEHRLT